MPASIEARTYRRSDCAVFRKTDEKFGGLSNMAPGYRLSVNGVSVWTSEAIYQACRFPHLPDVQRLIIDQTSPMTAKMRSKPFRKDSRVDWDEVRVPVMRWCLRVKLVQNWEKFRSLLMTTGDQPIVEDSYKDDFWGAVAMKDQPHILAGCNVLGRLLMEIREKIRHMPTQQWDDVPPLNIPDFLLYGRPIGPVGKANFPMHKRPEFGTFAHR